MAYKFIITYTFHDADQEIYDDFNSNVLRGFEHVDQSTYAMNSTTSLSLERLKQRIINFERSHYLDKYDEINIFYCDQSDNDKVIGRIKYKYNVLFKEFIFFTIN